MSSFLQRKHHGNYEFMLIFLGHETGVLVTIQEKEKLSAWALQFMNVNKKNFIFTKDWKKN